MRKKLNLEPLTEELGLLCIHGRLNKFSYDETVTNPIALTSKSKITKLYAEYMHENLGHQGSRLPCGNNQPTTERHSYIARQTVA